MSIDRPHAHFYVKGKQLYALLPSGHRTLRDELARIGTAITGPFAPGRPCYRMPLGNRGLLELLIERFYAHWEIVNLVGTPPPWVREAVDVEVAERERSQIESGSLKVRPTARPVSATLWGLLAASGKTEADLVKLTDMTERHVSRVLRGEAPLTPEVAHEFEKATGTPARLWIRNL